MSDAPLPLPKNPLHLRFADLVLEGNKPAEAYRKAGYSAKTPQARAVSASRLLKNVEIATYLSAVRQRASTGAVLSLQAKREFLCRIVMTPLMRIDPNHPENLDGDLIKKYKRNVSVRGEDETLVTEEFEKLDPLKAIDLDNKLSGDDPESNAMGNLAAALAGLGGGGVAMDERM